MKDVQPEDIEDVSSQFVPLIVQERNADRVKRIKVKGQKPFFLISLFEHKTKSEYNIGMQIFRYMVYIWEAFAKEEEKRKDGISKTKDFKYPMILPIVYYEGSEDSWTAPLHFRDRIRFGELFKEYVPNFRYYLVPIRKFTNEELLEKGDEMSLLMLINKVQTEEDIEALRKIPAHRLEEILQNTSPHVLKIITDVLFVLLLKENVPLEEAEDLVEKVRENG
ncbi:MAG: Rpn family recombination-promoting nuclease/putative transposase [Lachnospiraceae bacterium]|nr:Rpn family recombination-promoting nuclease/putative transposase [Lachnospiraceae bacterium]